MQAIGKYYSLKEDAMFTRIKFGSWTLILFSVLMIIGNLQSDRGVTVSVRPDFNYPHPNTVISGYGSGNIKLTGEFEISKPTFTQRLLLPDSFFEFDSLNCLLIIVLSVLVLRLLPYIHSSMLFQADISKRIKLIGFALIIFWIVDMLRIFFYTIPEISSLTNHQFKYQKSGFMVVPLPLWLGIIILWISSLFKKAFSLKQEQQLTI